MVKREFIVTSILEFTDRYEGQVFGSGTYDECLQLQKLPGALIYNGSEKIVSSQISVFPVSSLNLADGERFKLLKAPAASATSSLGNP